jgi:hypothetical protein
LKSEIADMDEDEIKELSENELMKVSLYVNNGKVVMNEIYAEETSMALSALQLKDEHFIEFHVESDYETVLIKCNYKEEKKDGNTLLTGKLSLAYDDGDEKIEADLLQIEQEFLQKAELELVQLNDQNAYILNDKEAKDIEEKLTKIQEKLPDFLVKLDERLKNAMGEENYNKFIELFTQESDYSSDDYSDTYNDYEYDDYDYSDDYNYEY